jgi:hypothetical protein
MLVKNLKTNLGDPSFEPAGECLPSTREERMALDGLDRYLRDSGSWLTKGVRLRFAPGQPW